MSIIKKSIKRNEHIKKLSRDHHFSLLFCWKIRQGLKMDIETSRISKYVYYFWRQHLQQHFREEEHIFFAPIKDNYVRRAVNEHKYIKLHVESLIDLKDHQRN